MKRWDGRGYAEVPNRERFLSVRLSAEEHARLVSAADRDLPAWETAKLSKWARRVLLEAAPAPGQLTGVRWKCRRCSGWFDAQLDAVPSPEEPKKKGAR